ncbi:uncharacterized protein LOC132744985 [Ruditapes philippinarum]|uniref:uncharacterized protein LOC132744985 n=1 Tax=Ruditapes philippinarum TaxID=129788 RepID=UPI00295C2787|nr:uncharacterized protein LOC132744985 [Ruditapes philippinarum]
MDSLEESNRQMIAIARERNNILKTLAEGLQLCRQECIVLIRSGFHKVSDKVKQNKTSSKKEHSVQVKRIIGQGADNATDVSTQKEELGSHWKEVYLNGKRTEEKFKDIDGAIEIYQDPPEPNKRRTDYENEEEKYLKKKVEFSTSDIRIKEIKVQTSEFPRYEYALGNLLDVVMRYKVVLQSNCIGHDGRYIMLYICTTPENDKMIDEFLQEISKKGEIRDGGSLEQFVQSKDQSTVSCFITHVSYQRILTAIRHRTTITIILGKTDLEEKAKRYQNTYAIQKNNAWKQIDLDLEEWLFQSLKPVCGALGGDIESNRSDKKATDRDEYEEKPITGK